MIGEFTQNIVRIIHTVLIVILYIHTCSMEIGRSVTFTEISLGPPMVALTTPLYNDRDLLRRRFPVLTAQYNTLCVLLICTATVLDPP